MIAISIHFLQDRSSKDLTSSTVRLLLVIFESLGLTLNSFGSFFLCQFVHQMVNELIQTQFVEVLLWMEFNKVIHYFLNA